MYLRMLPHDDATMLTSDALVEKGEDWSGVKVERFGVNGGYFDSCVFDRLRVGRFSVGGLGLVSEFVNCSFDSANIAFGTCGPARFVNCSFRGARLKGFNFQFLDLVGCDFSGAVLRQCVFWGAPTARSAADNPGLARVNVVEGNDFSSARLIDSDFRYGVDLTRQKLPSGPEYAYCADGAGALVRVRRVVESWRESAPRDYEEFMIWLKLWEKKVKDGQPQLFFVQEKPDMSDAGWAQVRQAVLEEQR